MSGVEILGLILGIIPILQIGLHQAQSRKSKILIKYHQALADFCRDLHVEEARIRSTCERLLSPLVDEDELADLLDNPDGKGWKDKQLQIKLKDRLGDKCYDTYLKTLQRLGAALLTLKHEIGESGSHVTVKNDKWHEKMNKRLKACLKNSRHFELLGEIEKCNTSLARLTDDAIELGPIRKHRKSKGEAKKLESLRQLAKNLHRALDTGLDCECTIPHLAHLRLESRRDTGELEVRFGVLFSKDSKPRGWQETEIRIPRDVDDASNISTLTVVTASSTSLRTSRQRSVSFSLSDSISSDTVTGTTDGESADGRIEDLCRVLRTMRKKAGCIEVLDDESHKHYYIHTIYPPTMLGEDLSLTELLSSEENGAPHPIAVKLGLRDKYDLAVILATSVLQLHTTGWLDDSGWKEDVRFVRARGKNSPVGYAYIQKRFDRRLSQTPSPTRPAGPAVRNELIFWLGVTLIELSLGKPLAWFQTEDDLGYQQERNIITDLCIARRLLKADVHANEGDRYTETVNRCINCIFEGLEPSLEDAKFRQAFYEGVVVPLREVRDNFIG